VTCPGHSPSSNGLSAFVRTWTVRSISPGWRRPWGRRTPWAGASPTPCRLTQALEQTTARETVAFPALCRLPLGEAQLRAGHLEEAHALAEQALAQVRAHQERSNQAWVLRLLGDIAARCSPLEGEHAVAHYQQALALAEELGMRPLQAHCHRGLGTLYGKVGRQDQARAELCIAIELYRSMGMTFWLPQVEATLAQVEKP
jgi:tetratricopeptide (TPR) repeat protein